MGDNAGDIDKIVQNLLGFVESSKMSLDTKQIHQVYNSVYSLQKLYKNDIIDMKQATVNLLGINNDRMNSLEDKVNSLESKIVSLTNSIDQLINISKNNVILKNNTLDSEETSPTSDQNIELSITDTSVVS